MVKAWDPEWQAVGHRILSLGEYTTLMFRSADVWNFTSKVLYFVVWRVLNVKEESMRFSSCRISSRKGIRRAPSWLVRDLYALQAR